MPPKRGHNSMGIRGELLNYYFGHLVTNHLDTDCAGNGVLDLDAVESEVESIFIGVDAVDT